MKTAKFWAWLTLFLAFGSFLLLDFAPKKTEKNNLSFSATQNEKTIAAAENKLSGESVYYVAGGGKYHLYEDCKSIAGKEILSSDKIFAENGGRTLCSVCKNRAGKPSEDRPSNQEEKEIPLPIPSSVYCTPNGKKYHVDRNCRYLKNSAEVSELSTEAARQKGLTPCSGCAG